MALASSTRRRQAVAASAVLAFLALAGCDGEASDLPAAATSGPNGLTPPGSELALGDTARITPIDGSAVIELTVTSIVRGTTADLRSAGYDAADTVYYVGYVMRLAAGEPRGFTLRRHLTAWAGDTAAGSLVLSERFPPCQERNLPTGATPGPSVASCRPYLTDRGSAPVDAVRFADSDVYGSADGDDIVWR